MNKELIQEYIKKFDQTFSLLKNDNKVLIWGIDLSEENLRKNQQEFADRMFKTGSSKNDVFSFGALIFYGYRLGVVQMKGKNECFTRQDGYIDNAIWNYNLDEILNRENEDDNPNTSVSNIIEWTTNPGSNTDVAESVMEKMISPLVKKLCQTIPPGKRPECTIVVPPISQEIEVQNWSDLFVGVKAKDLLINIVNYGYLLSLDENDRQYILQYQTDGFREYIVISAYEVIRGHNTCLGCLAFDPNDFDYRYILQDVKPVSFTIDNRKERYDKKEKLNRQNDWHYLPCQYSVSSGFSSFLGNHAASFGRELYKLNNVSHFKMIEVKAVFHKNESLQVIEVCARLIGQQNLYNIALGDLVYIANILQRDKAFKIVSIGTTKNYKLGTYKQFDSFIDVNKLPEIPSNYNSFSWKLRDNHIKLIPYFQLDAKKHTENQIIESVVEHFEHCTAEIVADELLYLFKNGEDPSAYFVVKVFMYMSQMDSLEIESRNEIIANIENVDDVTYQEIDQSNVFRHPQRKPSNSSVLKIPIEELNLTEKTYNCLKRARVYTVKDIVEKSSADLMKIRHLGMKANTEIVGKIHRLGLKMSGE